MYLGDFKEDGDVFFKFTTRAFGSGVPFTLSNSPVLSVYVDEGISPKTTAEAYFDLDVDFNSKAGLNNVRIDLSGDAFFATGADYAVVITTGQVDSVSVIGETLFTFSIENRSMGQPAGATLADDIAAIKSDSGAIKTETDKLTFTVALQLDTNPLSWAGGTIPAQGVTGVPEVDVTHHTAGIAPAPATTGVPDVNTVEFLDTAVVLSNGLPDINVEDWLGTLVAAATAGVPNVNTTTFLNVAVSAATASGEIAANVTEWVGNAVTHGTGGPDVNINAVSDDTVAAATLELFVEKMDQSTGQIDSGSFAAGAINAAAIATDAITAAKIAANAITSSEIADGAITVAKITALDSAAWANAQNFFDATGWVGGTIKLTADMTKISGSATAADKLEEGAEALVIGEVNDASASTTVFVIQVTGDTISSVNDFYNGRIITFTSGNLLQQSTDITGYNGTTKAVTVTALTAAPDDNSQIVIS